MAEHTLGPWHFDGDWYRIPTIFGRDGKVVASIEKDERKATPERSANASLIAAGPDMLAALKSVNKLISEAAMTGFNCHDGDWAERLFYSQQATSAAIKNADPGYSFASADRATVGGE